MAKGEDSIRAPGEFALRSFGDAAHGLGHAADRAENPNLIADPDLPIRAPVTHEFTAHGRGRRARRGLVVWVLIVFEQIGGQIMDVNLRPGCNVLGRMTNRVAILHDHFTALMGPQCDLVAARRSSANFDDLLTQCQSLTRAHVSQAHRDTVGGVYLQQRRLHPSTRVTRSSLGLKICITRSAMR